MEAIVNNLCVWLCGILLLLTLALGFSTYVYHEKYAEGQKEIITLTTDLRQAVADTDLAKKSCAVTTTITNEVSTKIEDKQDKMTKTLVDLVALPPAKDTNNGKKYADDASLSPELMRLLNKAYCDASPTDTACTASGTNENVSSTKAKR